MGALIPEPLRRRLIEAVNAIGTFEPTPVYVLADNGWTEQAIDIGSFREFRDHVANAVAILAQGIAARSDETQSGSAKGKSPVATPCAQGLDHDPQ